MELDEENYDGPCLGNECKNKMCPDAFCPSSDRINIINFANTWNIALDDITKRLEVSREPPKNQDVSKLIEGIRYAADRAEQLVKTLFNKHDGDRDPPSLNRVSKRKFIHHDGPSLNYLCMACNTSKKAKEVYKSPCCSHYICKQCFKDLRYYECEKTQCITCETPFDVYTPDDTWRENLDERLKELEVMEDISNSLEKQSIEDVNTTANYKSKHPPIFNVVERYTEDFNESCVFCRKVILKTNLHSSGKEEVIETINPLYCGIHKFCHGCLEMAKSIGICPICDVK
jgi:hypothetical protein